MKVAITIRNAIIKLNHYLKLDSKVFLNQYILAFLYQKYLRHFYFRKILFFEETINYLPSVATPP